MADLFCIRTLSRTNLHLFFPSTRFSSSLVQSNNSRISNGITRRRGSPRLRVRCTASSQTPSSTELDVISTHEHTDGSLVFRFGDPSEAAKNAEKENSKIVNEKDVDSMVQESEYTVKEADREVSDHVVTTEINNTDSVVVDSNSYTVAERENDSVVPVLEDLVEVVGVDSVSSFHTDKEEQLEYELKEEVEFSSSKDVPVLDKDSDTDHSMPKPELSEKVIDNLVDDVVRGEDVSESDVITADVDADSDKEEINDHDLQDTVQTEKTKPDSESKTSTISAVVEEDLTSSNGLADDDNEAKTSSSGAEAQTSYAENKIMDAVVEDDSENGTIQSISHLEAEPILNEETGVDTLEESEVVETIQSTPVIEEFKETQEIEGGLMLVDSLPQNLIMGLEPILETAVDTVNESEGVEIIQSTPLIEESNETQETKEDLMLVDSLPNNLTIGLEITEEDDVVLRNDSVQKSGDQVADIEPSESFMDSQDIADTSFVLSSGAAVLPHPSKVLTGGEDSYFIAGQTWLGVADGAGHWSFQGTNPGLYAVELMKNCERLVSDLTDTVMNSPVELLNRAMAESQCSGSSTAVIAQLDGQALRVANIGNSGFIVIRNGSILKRSSPMLHAFHFPLQIEEGSDLSLLAESYQMDVEEGDVLITSTDGLLDNLYDHEISSIVANSLDEGNKTPQDIAEMLATKAQEIGMSGSAQSPFAENAQNFGFADYKGGKLDDVAVIVSFVQKLS